MNKLLKKLLSTLFLVFFAVCLFSSIAIATTYYVDATNGNDNSNGRSQSTAWRTLNKVNGQNYNPGDIIAFKSGAVWYGTLSINKKHGTKSSPIIFTKYGSGKPPIFTGAEQIPNTEIEQTGSNSIFVFRNISSCRGMWENGDIAYTMFDNLNKIKNGNARFYFNKNEKAVYFKTSDNTLPGSRLIEIGLKTPIWIENSSHVIVQDLVIKQGAWDGIFIDDLSSDISILNCEVYNAAYNGIESYGARTIIADCKTYDNGGVRGGSGITINLASAANCIIENNTSYNNGGWDDSWNLSWGGQIQVADAAKYAIIRYNYCYSDPKLNIQVETGIDLEAGASNCKIYYNIIKNIARGINIASSSKNNQIFNNTVVGFHNVGIHPGNGICLDNDSTGNQIKNNIIYTLSRVNNHKLSGGISISQEAFSSAKVSNNCYYMPYDKDKIVAVGSTKYDYSTWVNSIKKETASINQNPNFLNQNLSITNHFTLDVNSPCIDSGLNVGLKTDFFGNSVGNNPDIGAIEMMALTSPRNLRIVVE